eukprot:662713-Pleurochrysis_carterae.AAC.1
MSLDELLPPKRTTHTSVQRLKMRPEKMAPQLRLCTERTLAQAYAARGPQRWSERVANARG